MAESILVTGGAGFIGSHLVDALVTQGHRVRVFDNLEPQVHGPLAEQGRWPTYANPGAEYVLGDVRDREALRRAVVGAEVIYHLAAGTGVGQSMYQIAKYVEVNVQGTANLLDILVGEHHALRRLVLASSRAVYGEGAYRCATCGMVHPPVRTPAQLDAGQWEPLCPGCGGPLASVPAAETLTPDPGSIYAVTKLTQEQMCLCTGQAYGFPVTVLRFFNVYGPRQSLSNPYTGIITAFLTRLQCGGSPEVYEDGGMTRDFVHVSDVVAACQLAMQSSVTPGGIFNAGSGQALSIMELARLLCRIVAPGIAPHVSGAARVGDIRHCTADLTVSGSTLGYAPSVALEMGLRQVAEAAAGVVRSDVSDAARRELAHAGLLR